MNSYDKIADSWHNFRKNTTINKCVREFCEYLPSGANILDAGCGTGYPIDDYLVKNGYCVTGIDPSEKMLEKAKELRLDNARFLTSDFLNFDSSSLFDAVIAFDSLWYIPLKSQPEIYKKAENLLKKGGYFMFTHGRTNGEIYGEMFEENFRYAALDLDTVIKLLRQNGFETLRIETDYKEITTGTRDLLVFARKVR